MSPFKDDLIVKMATFILILGVLALISGVGASLSTCAKCQRGYNEADCPDFINPDYVTLKTNDDRLEVTCRSHSTSVNVSLFEGCDFSTKKVVMFKNCPFPNETFSEFLTDIGLLPQEILQLFYKRVLRYDVALRADHLFGLPKLKYLTISGYNFTHLPDSLLRENLELEDFVLTQNTLDTVPSTLFETNRRIRTIKLRQNDLTYIPANLFRSLANLSSVQLDDNNIAAIPDSLFKYNPKIKHINLSKNRLSTFSQKDTNISQLNYLILHSNKISKFPENAFSTVTNLSHLDLQINSLTEIPDDLFSNTKNLEYLYLNGNRLSKLSGNVFNGLEKLLSIDLGKNILDDIHPSCFKDLKSLESLRLHSNNISYIPVTLFVPLRKLKELHLGNNSLSVIRTGLFTHLTNLEKLDLKLNVITTLEFPAFPDPSKLVNIDLSYNHLDSWPAVNPLNGQHLLKSVNMASNLLSHFPGEFLYLFKDLKELILRNNSITYVEISSFIPSDLTVDLRNNSISTVNTMYLRLTNATEKVHLYLSNNPFNCDCIMYYFILAVSNRDRPRIEVIDAESSLCARPQTLESKRLGDIFPNYLVCEFPHDDPLCPTNCQCYRREFDLSYIVDCSNRNLSSLPDFTYLHNNSRAISGRFNNVDFHNLNITLLFGSNRLVNLDGINKLANITVQKLSLEDNSLTSLNMTAMPSTIRYLNVRGNEISDISESTLHYFNFSKTRLALSGNPWLCECNHKNVYNFVKENYLNIEDYSQIYCRDFNKSMSQLSEEEVCPYYVKNQGIIALAIVLIVLVAFGVITATLIIRYSEKIKVWLFAHRLCLWFITEEEMDNDKKYDAFISYSHKDEEFVSSVLVPGLESGDPKYEICLHYRDWIPGEFIHNQILRSVGESRRTIIVLSNHFLESDWGQLEFKTAHQQALRDKTNRIIIIVYGEVPESEKLDEELSLYVSMNTYLKWGDLKFWQRLRYAMPHSKYTEKKPTSDRIELR